MGNIFFSKKKFHLKIFSNNLISVSSLFLYTIIQSKNYLIYFNFNLGEAKMQDLNANLANEEIKKFNPEKAEEKKPAEKVEAPTTEAPTVAEGGEVNEEGLDPESIKTVVEQTKCTREAAVKELRKLNGDFVTAILNLTQS